MKLAPSRKSQIINYRNMSQTHQCRRSGGADEKLWTRSCSCQPCSPACASLPWRRSSLRSQARQTQEDPSSTIAPRFKSGQIEWHKPQRSRGDDGRRSSTQRPGFRSKTRGEESLFICNRVIGFGSTSMNNGLLDLDPLHRIFLS